MKIYELLGVIGLAGAVVCLVLTALFVLKNYKPLFPLIGFAVFLIAVMSDAVLTPTILPFGIGAQALEEELPEEPEEGEEGDEELEEEEEEPEEEPLDLRTDPVLEFILDADPEMLAHIQVKKGLGDISITLPESFSGGEYFPPDYADLHGYKKVEVSADGSATIAFPKKLYNTYLEALQLETTDALTLLKEEEGFSYIQDMLPSKSLDAVEVQVLKDEYRTAPDSYTALPETIHDIISPYFTFAGLKKFTIDVVNVEDAKDVLDSFEFAPAPEEETEEEEA